MRCIKCGEELEENDMFCKNCGAKVEESKENFEESREDTLSGHIDFYQENEPKGEFVLILEGISEEQAEQQKKEKWETLTIEEHMALYPDLPEKEAMKRVAKERGVTKREIYSKLKA